MANLGAAAQGSGDLWQVLQHRASAVGVGGSAVSAQSVVQGSVLV